MGGEGSGRLSKEAKIVRDTVQRFTPIANSPDLGGDFILPNHSGDHSAGHTGTPVNGDDISNKDYVDNTTVSSDFVNGSFRETFDARVTSDGATVTLTVEQPGGGDLQSQTSLTNDPILDATPTATITLTAGSDASPTANYVYFIVSTGVLTVSTSDWPNVEHVKVAYVLVPSATFVAANGAYINQNWNDHLKGADEMGHMLHISESLRRKSARWFSGVSGNGTDNYLTPTAGNVELKSSAGVIYQLHKHAFPVVDTSTGDEILVKNWNGDSYHNITNLYDITADSGGNTIGNNKYFNLVIWGVGNKTGEYQPIMINLPGGFYNTQIAAEQDIDGVDDFDMSREFNLESSTGFLISRMTIQMKTGGGTWVVASSVDLRGNSPVSASGGVSSTISEFHDNNFRVIDEADESKEMAFSVGGITTATTRTYTAPDKDGTLALTNDKVETFPTDLSSGSIVFSDGTNLKEDNFHLFFNESAHQIEVENIKLVSDGTQASPSLKFNDTNTGFFKSGDSVRLSLNNSTVLAVDATGVGIGTTSPVDKLEVKDGSITINHTTGSAHLQMNALGTAGTAFIDLSVKDGDADYDARFRRATGVNGELQILNRGTGNVQLGTDNSVDLIIKTGGDVGIGTTSPTAKLHIDQASTTDAIPVLTLDQADISEEMISFETTVGFNNPITTVGARVLTTTHFIKVTLPGGLTRYIPAGTIA